MDLLKIIAKKKSYKFGHKWLPMFYSNNLKRHCLYNTRIAKQIYMSHVILLHLNIKSEIISKS